MPLYYVVLLFSYAKTFPTLRIFQIPQKEFNLMSESGSVTTFFASCTKDIIPRLWSHWGPSWDTDPCDLCGSKYDGLGLYFRENPRGRVITIASWDRRLARRMAGRILNWRTIIVVFSMCGMFSFMRGLPGESVIYIAGIKTWESDMMLLSLARH